MENKTFESSLLELENIIRQLENGEITIDESISKYKEASSYVEFCTKKLEEANNTVNKILNNNGVFEDFKD